MKRTYHITKTSDRRGIHPPCKGAYRFRTELSKYIRTFKDHDEWERKFPEDFKRKITDRGVTSNGYPFVIVEQSEDLWVIDIAIENLHDFVKKEGRIILSRNKEYIYPELEYCIEIYDSYRE